MKRKNIAALYMLISSIAITTLSDIYSSARVGSQPAKRRRGYLRVAPKNSTPEAPQKQVIQGPTEEPKEQIQEVAIPEPKQEETVEKAEDIKQMQQSLGKTQTPSIWTMAYLSIAPVILASLNKAFDTGIGAATKSTIKQLWERKQLLDQKPELLKQQSLLTKEIESIKQSTEIGPQEKSDLLKFFGAEKKKLSKLEKETSFTHIFSTAIYMGMLNTIIPTIGTLLGFGATLVLQSLMPSNTQ